MGTRPKAERIGGRRVWQEDIGSLKKPQEKKTRLPREELINRAVKLADTVLN
jgi:hypothetical protein